MAKKGKNKGKQAGNPGGQGPQKPNQPKKNPPPPPIPQPHMPNRDLFHRVNFSYQAAIFLQNLGESSGSTSTSDIPSHEEEKALNPNRKGKRRAMEYQGEKVGDVREGLRKLARAEMKGCRTMVAHNQLKLDPALKRTVCGTCSTVLVPGLTSRVRNRPNSSTFNVIHITCLTCSSTQSIPAPPVPGPSLDTSAETLDGPVRAAKRRKVAKRSKRPFFEAEKPEGGGQGKGSGHVLWRGDERLAGWGVLVPPPGAEETAPDGEGQQGVVKK
ncbi:hypothetical protein IAT38_000971 [Cryptococcus sp. DSM 104549]